MSNFLTPSRRLTAASPVEAGGLGGPPNPVKSKPESNFPVGDSVVSYGPVIGLQSPFCVAEFGELDPVEEAGHPHQPEGAGRYTDDLSLSPSPLLPFAPSDAGRRGQPVPLLFFWPYRIILSRY